ncbi:MAG: hypothetical protein AAB821_01010 [Patescibacteria group bacterium]
MIEKTEFNSELAPDPQKGSVEKRKVTYENALEAARRALSFGATPDTWDERESTENPESGSVDEQMNIIERWVESQDLLGTIDTIEKATAWAIYWQLWVKAGLTEPFYLKNQLEQINDEISLSLNAGVGEEVLSILENVKKNIEILLPPEMTVSKKIENKIQSAKELAKTGKFNDAISSLSSILVNPAYKTHFKSKKNVQKVQEIIILRGDIQITEETKEAQINTDKGDYERVIQRLNWLIAKLDGEGYFEVKSDQKEKLKSLLTSAQSQIIG